MLQLSNDFIRISLKLLVWEDAFNTNKMKEILNEIKGNN